jgi:hypothetical protein
MKIPLKKNILFGVVLIASNLLISLLLAYVAGSAIDSLAFTQKMIRWRETGVYPFPHWLLYLVPRLGIWPVVAEIAYELSQMLVWICNGYLIRRFFSAMRPMMWTWVPFIVHLLLRDPVQILIGTTSYYLMAKSRSDSGV